ncbi:hypothetical protein AAEX28_04395 [Lentisphaerota bacterium WC36G]|nr:hypothetical protein LJT99_07260 [Lentisphaerae bacterium WC36]
MAKIKKVMDKLNITSLSLATQANISEAAVSKMKSKGIKKGSTAKKYAKFLEKISKQKICFTEILD